MRVFRALFAAGMAAVVVQSASAAGLGLTLLPYPDITSVQIDVTYTSSMLMLEASGFSIAYENDGLSSTSPFPINNGLMLITANVDSFGVASGGTLTIS